MSVLGQNDPHTMVGQVLSGRYRLTGVLGVGAMGTVYRADDLQRGEPIAIKLLRRHLGANLEAGARFRREAGVGERIIHPNCVEVFDFDTADDGSVYMTMELLEGEPLGELMARHGPIPWPRALRIARHVLRGLDHAHRAQVVHRDIKPDNIFLERRDDDPDFAKVLDFGIAKLIGEVGKGLTSPGITVGTPSYLSPEQATGGVIDGRSDVYSLSVVLFEMLTGRTPFTDPDPLQILFAHAQRAVPAFAEVRPGLDVPAAVEALVREGLAKKHDDRISSAAEYVVRITALLDRAAATPNLESARPSPEPGSEPEAEAETAPRRRITAPPPLGAAPLSPLPAPPPPLPLAAAPPLPAPPSPSPRTRRRTVLLLGGIGVAAITTIVAAIVMLASRDDAPAGKAPVTAQAAAATAPSPLPAKVASAIRELERGKNCSARRQGVRSLRALGNPMAIPFLEKAKTRLRRGKNTNACLLGEAEAAIAELSAKPDANR